MITVRTRDEAWAKANELFPTDYELNETYTRNAGYPIYSTTLPGKNIWISDLNSCLELNLENCETIRINIVPIQFQEYQLADALSVISEAIYQIDDNILTKLQAETGIGEARAKLYGAYAEIAKILRQDFPDSKLFKQYNLQDAE